MTQHCIALAFTLQLALSIFFSLFTIEKILTPSDYQPFWNRKFVILAERAGQHLGFESLHVAFFQD